MTPSRKKVIFVGSTSYSGSTMMDLVVANDPRGFSCGELSFTYRPEQAHHLTPRCACADPTCRIWKNLRDVPEKDFYPAFFDQHPGIDFAVDSSKDPLWIARQRGYLAAHGIDSAVLIIWKDPLEIAASFKSRKKLDQWKRHWMNYHRLLVHQLGADFITLSYRDFATRPERLEAVCAQLGIPYFEGKERYWEKVHHTLFGNRSARRHLNEVEATLMGGTYVDSSQLHSIYYKAPNDPELAAHIARQKAEDPLIGRMEAFLEARGREEATPLPEGLAMSDRDVALRRIRRSLPRRDVVKARARVTLNLHPKPQPAPDRAKRQLAFVLPGHVSAQAGGAEYQASLILQELARASGHEGREATYLCRQGNLGYAHPSHRVSVLPKIPVLSRYTYFVDLPVLTARLKALKPAVIYNRDAGAYTWACAKAAKATGAKFVLHLAHDKDVTPMQKPYPRNFLKRIDKTFLEKSVTAADHIIAQTPLQAELLKKHYDRDVDMVLPNAQPVPTLPDPALRADPPMVLWVANFKDFKQPELFLDLARRLEGTGAQFVMVGQAKDDYADLRRQIEAQPNLTHLGALPQGEVLDLMARAAIFVNTSTAEGFPNTFLQAWMRAVPVVSLNADPGDALQKGMGYRSGSLEAMEADIARLLADPALRAEVGARARAFSAEAFGLPALSPLLDLLT